MKLFLDPRQAHVKTIKAGLEALLERLFPIRHGLLLSTSRGTGNDKGHTRRDPAHDRNAGHHHHGAHQTTRKRDRHVIPIPRGRYAGESPPETVTPRTERAARNTSLEQPRGRAAKKHHASGHAGDHDDRPQRGVARDRTPGSTHEILLTRYSLRHLQHGRRGFPARDLHPSSCGRRPVRDGERHPRHRTAATRAGAVAAKAAAGADVGGATEVAPKASRTFSSSRRSGSGSVITVIAKSVSSAASARARTACCPRRAALSTASATSTAASNSSPSASR